jgi:hypothetical protein
LLQEFTLRKFSILTIIILLSLITILLTACTSNKNEAAVKAIEGYINALSNKDTVQITNLSCTAWEQDALVEVDSLTSVGSSVENLACTMIGEEESEMYITCTGYLALDYNGEAQQIDLSTRTYIAKQEDGQWRMCGYH